jgi:GlpG protein
MRRIGTLTNGSLARQFCDYLVTLSIEATTEPESDQPDTPWNIWIRDEQDVEQARQELAGFSESPQSQRYQVSDEVARIRDDRIAEQQRRTQQHRKVVHSMPSGRGGMGPLTGAAVKQQGIPVTIGIIIISVIVSFTSHFGNPRGSRVPGKTTLEERTFYGLSFVDWRDYQVSEDSFASIKKGQPWRFVTPMFLHGDEFHLAFNMLWIFFLGSAIERLHGSLFLVLLTVGTQVAGMLLQVLLPDADFLPEALHGSPFAIGASGAVYGLFGFLWVRPALDPDYPIHLVPTNVVLMLGWLVLCMTPLIPNVANGAHLGGLGAGILAAMVAHAIGR